MTGGTSGSGGSKGTGSIQGSGGAGAGGGPGAGGSVTTGGSAPAGGTTAVGGKTGLGGSPGSGGATASGGAIATGGKPGTGGALSTGGTTGVDGGGTSGEYGFTYSKPGSNQVSCTGPNGARTEDVADADWLCTFHIGGKTAHVYAQADATGAQCMMTLVPVFGKVSAQISVDGVVSTLSNAKYDAGGNHHNDSLQFDYQDKTYKYYHSSFGFGWRACQPMDCINVYKQGSTTIETEGCSSARTLPEVCAPINAPLVDTFKKCPGDTST